MSIRKLGILICLTFVATALSGLNATLSSAASPKKIAFVRNGDVWLMNTSGDGQRRIVDYAEPANDAWNINKAWSPSGNKLAIANSMGRNSLSVLNLSTGKLRKRLVGQGITNISDVDWLSESRLVFVGQKAPGSPDRFWSSNIYRLNLKTLNLTKLVKGGFDLAIAQNRKKMAYVKIAKTADDPYNPGEFSGKELLKVKNLKTGKTHTVSTNYGFYSGLADARRFNNPRFSPNGKKIIAHTTSTGLSGSMNVLNMSGQTLASVNEKSDLSRFQLLECYGYAEFIDNERIAYLVYSEINTNSLLRISRYDNGDNPEHEIIGSFSFQDTRGFSLASDRSKLAFISSQNSQYQPIPSGKMYVYDLASKSNTLVAKNASSPTWQP